MKVLQVLPTLSAGGAEGFITNLGVSLTELGVDVRFFLMAGSGGERGQILLSRLRDAGIKVIGSEEHNVRSPMNIVNLVRMIRSWRPDIVQANLYAAEVLVAVSKILSLTNTTSYVHRLANTDITGPRSSAAVRRLDRYFHRTIACSRTVAQKYQDFIRSMGENKLVTITNGGLFPETVFSPDQKKEARKLLKILDSDFVVAHIGRMFPGDKKDGSLRRGQKGHDVLIESFAKAFAGSPGNILLMLGDGPSQSEAQDLAKSLGIEDAALFLGQQPEPWTVLAAADVFCFPSRFEGMPNVLLEAASCGLPVIASDIPEISDLNLDQGDAWLLRPVDDIDSFASALHNVRERKEELSGKARITAREYSERYSMKTCARRYVDVYEETLEHHSN